MQVQNNAVPNTEQKSISANKNVKPDKTDLPSNQNVNQGQNAEVPKEKTAEERVSVYLKVVSRLEGFMEQGELPTKAIEGFTKAIRKRLEDLGEQDKKTIANLPEFKQSGAESLDKLPDFLEKKLNHRELDEAVLALLKQPKFAELMGAKPTSQTSTYSPKDMVAKKAEGDAKPAPQPNLQEISKRANQMVQQGAANIKSMPMSTESSSKVAQENVTVVDSTNASPIKSAPQTMNVSAEAA
ncbi:hypothetical protein WDW89_12410 [Deltaproteobacteria bacterium TL4]